MQQTYKQPQRSRKVEDVTAPAPAKQDTEATAKLAADIDSILDEIDGVLETNAAEFVRGYVQEGGQ